MDYKAIFERLGATLNVEKQAWVVVPLNSKTIPEQIEDFLTKEYDVSGLVNLIFQPSLYY